LNKWDFVLVDLNPVRGSEQVKTRPCLIISASDLNAVLPVVNILPISTYREKKVYSNQVFIKSNDSGLNSDSVILSFQIRTVDLLPL
jgi:mRNA interferase MazF